MPKPARIVFVFYVEQEIQKQKKRQENRVFLFSAAIIFRAQIATWILKLTERHVEKAEKKGNEGIKKCDLLWGFQKIQILSTTFSFFSWGTKQIQYGNRGS